MPLRDAVPPLQAAAAAGRGGVLGHEDRVVAVRGLPAVVARFSRRQPLRDDLRGVSPHRLRTAQLSRGPLAPAQVEPPPERSRARAVDPVIDLCKVGHGPQTRHGTVADNEAKTGRVSARLRTISARRRDKRKWNSHTSSSASSTSGGRGPEAPGHRSRRGTGTPRPHTPTPDPHPRPPPPPGTA